MSWSVGGVVEDGDTSVLEATLAKNRELNPGMFNPSSDEQVEFALNFVHEAFDSSVVEGLYNVYLSGHSNPDMENDRKSLAISFSAIYPTVEG